MRVGVTDARLGDATTASDTQKLQELRVPQTKVDPREVQRQAELRQGVGAGATCTDTDMLPAADNLPAVEASTLCLLNGERSDHGLQPLNLNDKLAKSAIGHTTDMVENGYFDHAGRDGSDVVKRVKATGYIIDGRAWTVGENLAWGTGTLSTPKGIFNAWMNSEGHRANILKAEYREIGFGVAVGNPRSSDGQGATYTTNFGAVSGSASSSEASQVAASGSTSKPSQRTLAKRKALKRKRAKAKRARAARNRRARAARARRQP